MMFTALIQKSLPSLYELLRRHICFCGSEVHCCGLALSISSSEQLINFCNIINVGIKKELKIKLVWDSINRWNFTQIVNNIGQHRSWIGRILDWVRWHKFILCAFYGNERRVCYKIVLKNKILLVKMELDHDPACCRNLRCAWFFIDRVSNNRSFLKV